MSLNASEAFIRKAYKRQRPLRTSIAAILAYIIRFGLPTTTLRGLQ